VGSWFCKTDTSITHDVIIGLLSYGKEVDLGHLFWREWNTKDCVPPCGQSRFEGSLLNREGSQ